MSADLKKVFTSAEDLISSVSASLTFDGSKVTVTDKDELRNSAIDILIYNAVFAEGETQKTARKIIRLAGREVGAKPDSIQYLYEAMGMEQTGGYTVPAINIRALTYDTARAIIRAAQKNNSGTFIFEIAKSEIGYTFQRPDEYAVCIIAAAIKEGYVGPLFIQGDHFQVNAKNFAIDPDKELESLKALIKEGIEAEFYNIDIDASTLVDLSRPTVTEQQAPNFEVTAEMSQYIRELEPEDVTVSIGGEIGEVGKENSTEQELRAFMDGLEALIGGKFIGISKISIQTGTSHGGVPLPDGTVADANVDFDTIEKLSKVSREFYGLSGAVQHGASTLPDEAFHLFAEKGASEVHLATGFQNMVYDSKFLPEDLKNQIYDHLRENMAEEKKDGETDEQFIYKTRKKGFGPFKKQMWDLPEENIKGISKELEDRFDYLFKKLKAVNTSEDVKKFVG